MRAAILAVGSELLGTERLDTNSLRLTRIFRRHGVELARKSVVGDRLGELTRELELLIGRYELVITSGGLGPTRDDLTREAVAAICGRHLREDPEIVSDIREKFRSFGREMAEVNRRQARVVEGAEVLWNERGTAPGLRIEEGGTTLFLLPGVPGELEHLAERYLAPWLEEHADAPREESRTLKVAMMPESDVEERLQPLYDEHDRERIAVLSSPGEIRVEVSARGSEGGRREDLERMVERVRELVGPAVFTDEADRSLEEVVGDLLRERGRSLATAESCTGGMVASRITDVPGSSDYFLGALVVYSNDAKREVAGVDPELLEEHGAVSEPVARALARGGREVLGADYGLGITGIAGPGGGSDEKPVGLVHLGLAGPDAEQIHVRVQLPGDRARVRLYTTRMALEMLRRALLGLPVGNARDPRE